MRCFKVIPFSIAFLFLSACGADWGPEDDGDGFGDNQSVVNDIATQVLHQDTTLESGLEHSKQIRFFSGQIDYEDELINYSSDVPQEVDFSQYRLVLIDGGTHSVPGYTVTVGDAYEEDDIVTLEVNYTTPGNNCSNNDISYNPYVFVRIETTLDVVVTEMAAKTDCN
jgi:hypothetical protein